MDYNKLPLDIQQAIISANVFGIIEDICLKFGISGDDVGEVGLIVTHTLKGLLHPDKFRSELQKVLRLDLETSSLISTEVGQKIFHPLLPSLSKIYSSQSENATSKNSETNLEQVSPTQNTSSAIAVPEQAPQPAQVQQMPIKNQVLESQQEHYENSPVPNNLPSMPQNHDIMKYYTNTEPIIPGLPPRKPKPQPQPEIKKIVSTPHYTGTDPYHEPLN